MTSQNTLAELEAKLHYEFVRKELIEQALTHKSFANENRVLGLKDNERLEFLGDAVLDLVLGDYLMSTFEDEDEGGLSKRRASLVNEDFLNSLALKLEVQKHLKLGKGEANTNGREKPRILSSTLEAIFGAIFKDNGFEAASSVIRTLFAESLNTEGSAIQFERDFKTRLQEMCQKSFGQVPVYTLVEAKGPEHEKEFHVLVKIEDRVLGEGVGRTKKYAEQKAAEKALEVLS